MNFSGIAHRDMKPHNVLINQQTNKVVVCDFGSAKQLVKGTFYLNLGEPNLAYICSRCYRAPELIFGATNYSAQIDIWSTGCILIEMINGEPPFLGDSQIDQLIEIIKIMGTPSKQEVLEMNPEYNMAELAKFPTIKKTEWKNVSH
jgi:serine/threonine protein kinase